VVCLLGCCVEVPALDREAGVCWRKAAKKVERKKGRWDDMLTLEPLTRVLDEGGTVVL